jgi:hypothetical protein
MTIRIARLEKLLPGLTVEERLDAILERYRADLPSAFVFGESVPTQDVPRWNRLLGLLSAAHVQLGWYIEYVEATVTQLELRFDMVLGLQQLILALEDHAASLELDPARNQKRASLLEKQDHLQVMSEKLVTRIAEELTGRWLDVRLAEIAAESLAADCHGRDIVHPERRVVLRDCRERLLALHPSIEIWQPCELREPQDGQVERLLELLEREARR